MKSSHSSFFLLVNLLVLFVSIQLIFTPLCAQSTQNELVSSEYAYRRFTTLDGIPTNMIENLFQDSHGYLWFATEHGVSRFDGKYFKNFMANKSLPINKVEENDKGEIVIYGYYFINILNPKTGELKQTFQDRNLNYLVDASAGLPNGYSMITKRDVGKNVLFHLEADTLREVFYHPLFDKMDESQCIYYDEEQELVYIPTQENKIYIVDFKGNIIKEYSNIGIFKFLKREKEIWAFGLDGGWVVSTQKITQKIKFPQKISDFYNYNLIFDKEGNLLISDNKSIQRFCKGRFETIIDGVNFPRYFIFDSEGNFWLSSRSGIYNFFHLDVKTYKVNEKNADIVESVVPVGNNEGYFCTGNGKLIYYQDDKFKDIHYPPHPQGTSFAPASIVINDKIYFSTYQDILKLQNKKWSWLNIEPDIYHVASCKVGKDQWIIGGWNTLWLLDKNDKIQSSMSQRVLNRNTFYVAESDDDGNIWIGGHSGICCISKTDTTYFFSDSTMNAESVDRDKNGKVWFGCEGNIYYTENKTIKKFMSFGDDVIINLKCTNNGLLVVSSCIEVKVIDISTKQVKTFNFSNGFGDFESSWNTLKQDEAGFFYLATQSPNVLKFNANTLFDRQFTPQLQIEKAQLSQNNVDWAVFDEAAHLKYNNRNIKFEFVGLCFSNPNAVRYHYRLLGFQDEWSNPTDQREITFNNLPPGNYIFEIFADTGDEQTKTKTISYPFTIEPAFYQTVWFMTVIIVITLLLLILIIIGIIRINRKRILKTIAQEMESNILKINSVRLKSIPHFNANVLSAIEYYLMKFSKEEANEYLSKYSRFTNITLKDIDKSSRSLKDEVNYVKLYLDMEKLRFMEKFDYIITISEEVDENVMIPNMILHTYCENAIKHGLKYKQGVGKITISVWNKANGVMIVVEDNGIGRTAAREKHTEGTGQGLSILTQQIELYNRNNHHKIVQNTIDLLDTANAAIALGTRIELFVPYEFRYI